MTTKMTMKDVVLLHLLHDPDATAEDMQAYLDALGYMPTKFRVSCLRSDVRMTLRSLESMGLLRDDVELPPLPKLKPKNTSEAKTPPPFYYR
jgi:hypothetical protein